MLAASLPAYAGETITLSDLLGEARAKNPALSAMRYRYQAGRQQVLQAGALPDPMLEFGIQNLPVNSLSFNKDEMTSKMIGLSQTFPFFGKRGLKREAAAFEAQALEGDYREEALTLEKDVKVPISTSIYSKKAGRCLTKLLICSTTC